MRILNKVIFALKEYKRILTISRKPTPEEFKRVMKITGLGMLLVGIIGFIIQLIYIGVISIG
jgi:protein transport protein SEC61 subunit gamma-like protein